MEENAESFTLKCKVSGNPAPKLTWNVRGRIMRINDESVSPYAKYKATDSGLVIRNITRADQGNYKCKATQVDNGVADFQDLVIQLKVQRK